MQILSIFLKLQAVKQSGLGFLGLPCMYAVKTPYTRSAYLRSLKRQKKKITAQSSSSSSKRDVSIAERIRKSSRSLRKYNIRSGPIVVGVSRRLTLNDDRQPIRTGQRRGGAGRAAYRRDSPAAATGV